MVNICDTVQVLGIAKKSYSPKIPGSPGSEEYIFSPEMQQKKTQLEAAVGKRFESEYRREVGGWSLLKSGGGGVTSSIAAALSKLHCVQCTGTLTYLLTAQVHLRLRTPRAYYRLSPWPNVDPPSYFGENSNGGGDQQGRSDNDGGVVRRDSYKCTEIESSEVALLPHT